MNYHQQQTLEPALFIYFLIKVIIFKFGETRENWIMQVTYSLSRALMPTVFNRPLFCSVLFCWCCSIDFWQNGGFSSNISSSHGSPLCVFVCNFTKFLFTKKSSYCLRDLIGRKGHKSSKSAKDNVLFHIKIIVFLSNTAVITHCMKEEIIGD